MADLELISIYEEAHMERQGMWKPKNLEKHIDHIREKLTSIGMPIDVYRILRYGYILLPIQKRVFFK